MAMRMRTLFILPDVTFSMFMANTEHEGSANAVIRPRIVPMIKVATNPILKTPSAIRETRETKSDEDEKIRTIPRLINTKPNIRVLYT